MFDDNFFSKVEKKTRVNKDTIVDLAKKLNKEGLKNEQSLREVIAAIADLTGKRVPKEKEDKIVNTILKDKVPKSVDKFF